MRALAALAVALCASPTFAQREPVRIVGPEKLAPGQSGTIQITVTNTSPPSGTTTTPVTTTAQVTYTDGGEKRVATASHTINVVRPGTGPGNPWLKPTVALTVPADLTLDGATWHTMGAPGAKWEDLGSGNYRLSADSLAWNGSWITSVTVRGAP